MSKFWTVLIAGAFAAGAAQAQQAPQAYIGAGVATTDTTVPFGTQAGYKSSAKVFGGYEFTPNWGVEAGYTDLRKARSGLDYGQSPAHVTHEGSRSYVAAKAAVPVNAQVSLYGKLGVGYTSIDKTYKLPSYEPIRASDHETEAYGAVGAQYQLNPKVALIAEYERYGKRKQDGYKADTVTVGARYNF
jgi:OOP family OmpA-OmpF porin